VERVEILFRFFFYHSSQHAFTWPRQLAVCCRCPRHRNYRLFYGVSCNRGQPVPTSLSCRWTW